MIGERRLVAHEARGFTLLERDIDAWSVKSETGWRVVSESEILCRRSCACGERATTYNLVFSTLTRTAYCGSCFDRFYPASSTRATD